MAGTLEQEVDRALKAWDDTDVSQQDFVDAMEAVRAALKEREKRLPYHILLENGLGEIRERLDRMQGQIKSGVC